MTFFEKTNVPALVLGEIWQIADTENRGLLTKPGFCMVLRLIGCYQNGQQPSSELAFKPAPLPKFEGITLPAPPQTAVSPSTGSFPPGSLQPQLSGHGTGPIRVPSLDPQKVLQYSGLFERSGAQNGILDGATAKGIFEKAGLSNEVLGKIWMLSDRGQRGALDQTEFIIAMHLLTSMKTRAMTALPSTLPPPFYEAAARRGQRPPSTQPALTPGAMGVSRQYTGSPAGPPQSPLARPGGYSISPPQSAQTTGVSWLITQQEKAQYDRFFATIDTGHAGIINGEQAVRFFSDSRLPEDTLASIWDLADMNSEGQLNRDEFAVAMYLIKQQRAPNPPDLPAFLPPALIPPSMRGQQQNRETTAPSFDVSNAPPQPAAQKSAAEDLFGLDSPPQSPIKPQGSGTAAPRDAFAGGTPNAQSAAAKFQPQTTGGMFKPFMPTSAFGASLTQQHTGQSTTSSQGRTPQRSVPAAMDDLLGDNETHAEESSKLTNETTELANMSSQIGNLRTQMEGTQSKKATSQAELNSANAQKRDLEQRLQQFRAQYEAEVKIVRELQQQLTASRASTKQLGQDLAMVEGTYHDLQTQHNTVSQQLQADQQENAHLKQRISQINSEVSRLKPEIEKLKLNGRQQKGMVSINKKQLSTNESERDRLQSEKADLEREAGGVARSHAATSQDADPSSSASMSTLSSTNPFFRSGGDTSGPTAAVSSSSSLAPNPASFDALFGPPGQFALGEQAGTRAATPPATSFVGRTLPAAVAGGAVGAALGAGAMGAAHRTSSHGERTPAVSAPSSDGVEDGRSGSGQSNSGPGQDDRNGGAATPLAGEGEMLPGAFPDDVPRPSGGNHTDSTSSSADSTPSARPSKPTGDFDRAFADLGGEGSGGKKDESENAFGQPGSGGINNEFPPIRYFEPEDDSDSDSDSDVDDDERRKRGGFDDEFAAGAAHRNDPSGNGFAASSAAGTQGAPRVASGDDIAAARPGVTSVESTASDLPHIDRETSPPQYQQGDGPGTGDTGARSMSNAFPSEFDTLLPSRQGTAPTAPPRANSSPGNGAESTMGLAVMTQPNRSTDNFVDALSSPCSARPDGPSRPTVADDTKTTPEPKTPMDEFDAFDDLAAANEADAADAGLDFDLGRQSTDSFHAAFDTPAQATPVSRSMPPSMENSSSFVDVGAASSSTLGTGNATAAGPASDDPHDWDAIFSGLDGSKTVDTALGGEAQDPWGAAPMVANGTPVAHDGGGGVKNHTTTMAEDDDPILQRLTGMGYARAEALRALEMHHYDINKVRNGPVRGRLVLLTCGVCSLGGGSFDKVRGMCLCTLYSVGRIRGFSSAVTRQDATTRVVHMALATLRVPAR